MVKQVQPESYDAETDDGEGYRYAYDACGRMTRVQDPEGNVLHVYEYNGHGQVIRETDGEGKEIIYTYNALGWKVREQLNDADGNMVKQVQPESYDVKTDDGEGYRYAYDACGRMTQAQDPEGNVLHAYEYNGHGQIIRETDGEGKEVLYTYNALGWKVREQLKVKDAEIPLYRVTAYTYDSQGNKIEEAYGRQEVQKDGEPESWHRIYFSYDKNNHLTPVKDDFGAQVRYDYDCLGNVTLEERVIEEGVLSTVRYGYNKNGMCIQRTEKIQGNGEVKSAVTKERENQTPLTSLVSLFIAEWMERNGSSVAE